MNSLPPSVPRHATVTAVPSVAAVCDRRIGSIPALAERRYNGSAGIPPAIDQIGRDGSPSGPKPQAQRAVHSEIACVVAKRPRYAGLRVAADSPQVCSKMWQYAGLLNPALNPGRRDDRATFSGLDALRSTLPPRHSTASPIPAFSSSAINHQPSVLGRFAAFTLIELLVVISIIAVLAALAFPAVNGAINSARKAQARNDVQQIVAAVKAFKAEYGKFPTDDINALDSDLNDHYYDSNRDVIQALLGKNETLNPKKIVFLEARESGKGKSGLKSGSDEFVDPWGKGYIIKMDTNYNGKTEYYGDRYTTVIAFSAGQNANPEDPSKNSDDIYSFK